GCSAGAPSTGSVGGCTNNYNAENAGTGASTTGNIYGAYDMSGGAYEYVMGNMKVSGNGAQMTGYSESSNQNSGFTGTLYDGNNINYGRSYPAAKYYDTYNYSTSSNDHSSRYIKGDATYETSQGDGQNRSWYADYANFVDSNYPWFIRGGVYVNTTSAGVFTFSYDGGYAGTYYSFRLVLSFPA
ncbi:MAG: hypothetical protein RSF67_08355, partial [Clostridia bacterium]